MFLEIKFHDNDFSLRFIYILDTLWKTVHNNRLFKNESSDTEAFKDLHKKELLLPIIIRLVALEAHMHEILSFVEFTGGIKTPRWLTSDFTTKYFNDIDLEFHDTDEFTKEWQNGEHYYLNLKTGEVGQF